jgi:hypothetical protein
MREIKLSDTAGTDFYTTEIVTSKEICRVITS